MNATAFGVISAANWIGLFLFSRLAQNLECYDTPNRKPIFGPTCKQSNRWSRVINFVECCPLASTQKRPAKLVHRLQSIESPQQGNWRNLLGILKTLIMKPRAFACNIMRRVCQQKAVCTDYIQDKSTVGSYVCWTWSKCKRAKRKFSKGIIISHWELYHCEILVKGLASQKNMHCNYIHYYLICWANFIICGSIRENTFYSPAPHAIMHAHCLEACTTFVTCSKVKQVTLMTLN